MSLYSALNAGVAGLGANASAMATVADNISNMNTVGYKRMDAQFRTLVTDSGLRSTYSAGGVVASPIALVSKQGLIQASGGDTDLAIDGNGFFVTEAGLGGDIAYTRAGAFAPDAEGYLRNASGLYLMGWRLDAQGAYTNTGSVTALEPVRLSDLTGTAQPTTRIQVRANLQSSATPVASWTPGDMASGTVTPQFSRSFDVYDAQGGAHRITMSYVKTGTNQWGMEVHADPASDVTAANGLLSSGTLAFNADGSLDRANSTATLFDPLNIVWTNGAGSVPVDLDLGSDGGIDGMTQFGGESALISSNVDGGMLGNLASVQVGKDGVVTAIFDDGSSRKVFQLPIATFQNPNGLSRLSGNAYVPNQDSGTVTLNAPGSQGAGAVAANSLEASTVDLASEFTNMIRFQRAYSASSKIITTVDDMLREVSDLKR